MDHIKIPIDKKRTTLLAVASREQLLEKLKDLSAKTRERLQALQRPDDKSHSPSDFPGRWK